MKEEFLDYVEDIIEAMNDAQVFALGMDYDAFIKDKKTIYALNRALEIIGEASKQIPVQIRNRYPEIPWKKMTEMRDKVIHEYFGVDLKRVWITVKNEIPRLKPMFEEILKDSEQNPDVTQS